ncbi:hypothetical protein Tco_0101010, partial [Tanacetum coccineum]
SCDCRSSILLLVVILSAGRLVSAGRTMVLRVVIISAGRLVSADGYPFCWTIGFCWSHYGSAGSYPFCWLYYGSAVILSAGCTMLLLVVIVSAGRLVSAVILSAGRLVSAGRTMVLLVVILSAGCSVSAGGFIYADRVYVPAVCMSDIAGWLVSATSHLVSAGSLQSCWCNNVSAA